MKKSAFTLIELLAVISIITILASLAIPTFSKVMEKGRSVQDASNLKQLGLGIMGYTNDNSDSYPVISGSGSGWALLLNGTSGTIYVPLWKVFQSPFDNRNPSEAGGNVSPVSYAFNTYLTGISTSDVVSPSNCVMLAVYSKSYTSGGTISFIAGTDPTATTSSSALSNSSPQIVNNIGTFNGAVWLNILYADSHVGQVRAAILTGSAIASGTVTNIIWNH